MLPSPAAGVSKPSFPSCQECVVQNGPEPSRARRSGAAERTLAGEDRSETIDEEGKERCGLDSISETPSSETVALCVCQP
jgi:hypothetical protein